MQCAGGKQECTVELRAYESNGAFKHFVFYDPNGSDETTDFQMTSGVIKRQKKHSFSFLKASKLFLCYFEGKEWPKEIEDITSQFIKIT